MSNSVEVLKKRILSAKGEIKADLVLKGARIVNVFTGEILKRDVAITEGVIVGLGTGYRGREVSNLRGKWLVPGFTDGHIHIESTMLAPRELGAALLVHGTTTIISDPHEIANVLGLKGIRQMLQESSDIPFDIFFMAPSCVPATDLETAGADLSPSALNELKAEPRVLGLAEMMNFPGLLQGNTEVIEKIGFFKDKILDGHCPMLSGKELQAYLSVGIGSDHETTNRAEGLEKVESGMMLMIREGTSAKNLEELLPLINSRNSRRFCFVSDDLHAEDIEEKGHLNFILKKAVNLGLDPVTAIQLVTINPAEYFGLKKRGAIAPGYLADLVILDNLEDFHVYAVYKEGVLVKEGGKVVNYPVRQDKMRIAQSVPLNMAPFTLESLRIHHQGTKARVIGLVQGQIITRLSLEKVPSDGPWVTSDLESDILKLCVVERHKATGRIGLALVKGFGFKKGAIASSVAHDSHNIIAVGVTDHEIFRAVDEVRKMGGGLSVVCGDRVLAKTDLEIGGLMSAQPLEGLVKQLKEVKTAASSLHCHLEEPFMALSFLALPVIPELRLTDKGLVDVNKFQVVPLFSNNTV